MLLAGTPLWDRPSPFPSSGTREESLRFRLPAEAAVEMPMVRTRDLLRRTYRRSEGELCLLTVWMWL